MKDVVIIGGGASGLMCAISIKEAIGDHCNVTILERLERVGKKILATGNGRCNFTNRNLSSNKFNNAVFVAHTLEQFGFTAITKYFEQMGLFSTTDEEGRVYPFTDLASSVLDVLRSRVKILGAIEKCGNDVKKITNINNRFEIETTRGYKIEADYVVLATGGKASPLLGSNGSGYAIVKPWKLKVTDTFPGLVGLKTDVNDVKGLMGLRAHAKAKLMDKKGKHTIFEEIGEVQFKEDGISGIVIMQLATRLARLQVDGKSGNYLFELDLLPQMGGDAFLTYLLSRKEKMLSLENSDFLLGIFPKMLAQNILKRCKIDMSGYVKDLTLKDLIKVSEMVKAFKIEIKEAYPFEKAQVTVGGIDVKEMDTRTLEIKRIENAYACGELLDIDGECGGYNLHWAFASGYVVGKSIAKKVMSSD